MIGDKKAFTIIELLITITIFSIVITSSISLLGSALKHQKKVMEKTSLLNTASYATEYITRALRMARKDMDGNCIGNKNNFVSYDSGSRIRFLNYDRKCQEFSLSLGSIIVKKSLDNTSANLDAGNALTSLFSLVVEDIEFVITGNDQDDILQPKVIFALKLKSSQLDIRLNVQTGVSQRMLDYPY